MKQVFTFLMLSILFSIGASNVLIENNASSYVIALPENSSRYEKFAGAELQSHLEAMTGVKLPLVSENSIPPGKAAIAVGNTELAKKSGIIPADLPDEKIIIKFDDDKNLILSGGSIRGVMFAVYDFLEKQLGCHWLDEFTTVIPKRKTVEVPDLNLAYQPHFAFRRVSALIMTDTELWEKFILRNQGSDGPYLSGYDAIGAPVACHSFEEYAKRFPAGDTDFYAEDGNGKKLKSAGSSGPDFCLSNPKVIANVIESLRHYIKIDRERYKKYGFPPPWIYDISQNDGSQMFFCLCKKCKEITEKYGAPSGLLLHFINQIAVDIKKDYPEILIQTFAYNQGLKAPENIRPESNVIIRFCTTSDIFGAPFNSEANRKLQHDLESWSQISQNIGIWLYTYFFQDEYAMPYLSTDQFGSDFKYLSQNNVKTVYVENHNYYTLSFFALHRWLAYQLMQNPLQDAEKLIDVFFNGYYGDAALEMKEYYNYLKSFQSSLQVSVFEKKAFEHRNYLNDEFFRKTEDILNRAEAKCPGNSRYLYNIHRERAIVDSAYLRLQEKLKLKALDKTHVLNRYEKNRMELLNTVVPADKHNYVLPKIKNDIEFFRRSKELTLAMQTPPQEMLIPHVDGRDWNKARVIDNWSENHGLPSNKKITAKLMHDNENLMIRLEEKQLGRKLLDGPGEVWHGDDWELHFTEDCANGDLRMIAVGPTKGARILEVGRRPGGMPDGRSVNLETFATEVKSEIKDGKWLVELVIPFKNLTPEGNIKPGGLMYMNMFRSASHLGEAQAWNPTFQPSFHIPWRLGKVWIGKKI